MAKRKPPKSLFQEQNWDIFISYASEERLAVVVPLVRALRSAGLGVWYDEIESPLTKKDPVRTKTMTVTIIDAMDRCEQIWVVLSPNSISKYWPRLEFQRLAHLANTSSKKFAIIAHGMDPGTVQEILNEFRLLPQPVAIHPSAIDPKVLAKKAVADIGPRARMVMFKPGSRATDVLVFEKPGHIIFFNGGIEKATQVTILDLCGNQLAKNATKTYQAFWPELAEVGSKVQIGEADYIFSMSENSIYGHINTVGTSIFSAQEVKMGCAFNFGTNDEPFILYPTYRLEACTGGPMSDEVDPALQRCLKIAGSSIKSTWRRFAMQEDTFSLSGDEDT
ncbi:MAG TPA: toll/interleukin-1 receptor domain-containing protein [Candidatus Angelobacter sp.]